MCALPLRILLWSDDLIGLFYAFFTDALMFSFGKTEGLHNVTVQVGSNAYLHCPVVNLGEKEVRKTVSICILCQVIQGFLKS